MKTMRLCFASVAAILLSASSVNAKPSESKDLWDRVEHHYADSNGVKIHYVGTR